MTEPYLHSPPEHIAATVGVRVELPAHLQTLARTRGEITLDLAAAELTQRALLDALERRFPSLRGTLRDPLTGHRRPFIRFFACAQDLSHDPPDKPLPQAVTTAAEPFLIIGAVAGG